MAVLTAKKRKGLSKKSFAIPEKRAYPIHDEAHARNALARVAQHGTPEEKRRVRAAVRRRYPKMGKAASDARPQGVQVVALSARTRNQARLMDARRARGH